MIKLVTLFLSIATAITATAQTVIYTSVDSEEGIPCDTARYVVYYDMEFVQDTLTSQAKPASETMRLEIGDYVQSFYSYTEFQGDSVNAVLMKNGGSSFQDRGLVKWRLYRDYPAVGKTSQLEKFGMDRFVCTEDYIVPAWTPVPDSSAVILGYPCRMAVAAYKGRTWYAWYAEDIPMDAGPWKLGGLPGLILCAYDSRKHYVFTATGMATATTGSVIYYKGEKYEAVDRKALNGIYRRYYSDPVGYLTSNPKVTVHQYDKNGNEITTRESVAYNPIER